MTCHSGGALDIYIEPVLPKPQIVILGRSQVAQTLAKLGAAAGYSVVVLAPDVSRENFPEPTFLHDQLDLSRIRITPRTFVVVSTQGECDEEALEQALGADVAVHRVRGEQNESGKDCRVPAGEGNCAGTPGSRDRAGRSPDRGCFARGNRGQRARRDCPEGTERNRNPLRVASPIVKSEAKDPVCGMMVEVARAKHTAQFEGRTVYFCCPRCKQAFEQSPQSYAFESS